MSETRHTLRNAGVNWSIVNSFKVGKRQLGAILAGFDSRTERNGVMDEIKPCAPSKHKWVPQWSGLLCKVCGARDGL